jgi:sterol-4alpha-carboxylate 3-dehydrogenase (decarboxylating)
MFHVTDPAQAMAESLVLSANTHDFATCALRSAPIFGPNDTACIPTIHSCIAAGQTPFILGSGTNLQDFVYVSNIADAHVLACSNLLNSQTAAGQAIFITNGEPVTARDLCLAMWKEFGHVPKFSVGVPEGLAWWCGLGAEMMTWMTGNEGVLSRGIVSDGCRDRYVSIKKAELLLGYKPRVGLEEGIRVSCQVRDQRRSREEGANVW